jgi:hypothetical protein
LTLSQGQTLYSELKIGFRIICLTEGGITGSVSANFPGFPGFQLKFHISHEKRFLVPRNIDDG